MALLERVSTLIRANLNDLIDKAEHPEKMIKQIILDMENQLLQVKTQVAIAIADQHLLEKKQKENEEKIADWTRKAELALDKTQEDLARAAVERSLQYKQLTESFTQQVTDQKLQVETLKTALNKLQQKLEEARAKSDMLVAEHRRARTLEKCGRKGNGKMKKRTLLSAIALGAAAAVALVGCSGTSGSNTNADAKTITVGVFNGWPEGEAASYLWAQVLEDKGYKVNLEYADAGPVFAGLAKGDFDVAFDGWLPTTHASYFTQYGDKLVDLGPWNNDAKLTLAVNADAPIDSIDQLASHASDFGNRIVGIEPGAGLTEIMEKKVIPGYGLDKMDFVASSTPAMLAQLKKSLDANENIVVTLWRPHWAYNAYDLKDLKDPKGALGAAESIHTVTRTGFSADQASVNGWFKNFKMDSKNLFSLEDAMFRTEQKQSEYPTIVKKWMDENKDYVESLTS